MNHLAVGIDLFNRGLYWEAHEAWEAAWTPDRHGPERDFYKGLIQIAAGCLHYTRANRRGAVNKWRSGANLLDPFLPGHRSIALGPLVNHVRANLAAMECEGWPRLKMPVIEMTE
ncbi:MAG TPA: DUF309 domain-containing protein [Candidatus Dormibacteraeota bacterium]|jgi:hypothetical protein|nr:DUF309 domain-containing protein [Candidatus Dormibacteraeota bacterium]